MSAPTLRSLVAGLAAGAVAWLGAAAYVIAAQGFGAGDLRAFAIWCSLLAFFVAVIAHLLPPVWLSSRRLLRLLLSLCVGFVAALLFTLAAALGLGPWIGAFSFPVLFLWAGGAIAGLTFAVWPPPAPARSHGVKSFLLGIGVCLGLVVALPPALLLGSIHIWDRAESEVHLLPSGFRGPVIIVFRQADGAAPEREGRARLYRIPPDGVLRTQYEPNDGWSAPDYFYVDSSGQRTEIARGAPCADSLPGDPVQACLMGQLYIGDQVGAEYQAYVVTQQADRNAQYERGDSLVRAVIYGQRSALAP
jgi:hypothetical protein